MLVDHPFNRSFTNCSKKQNAQEISCEWSASLNLVVGDHHCEVHILNHVEGLDKTSHSSTLNMVNGGTGRQKALPLLECLGFPPLCLQEDGVGLS